MPCFREGYPGGSTARGVRVLRVPDHQGGGAAWRRSPKSSHSGLLDRWHRLGQSWGMSGRRVRRRPGRFPFVVFGVPGSCSGARARTWREASRRYLLASLLRFSFGQRQVCCVCRLANPQSDEKSVKCSTIRAARGDVPRRGCSRERVNGEKEGQREMRKTRLDRAVARATGGAPLFWESTNRDACGMGFRAPGSSLAEPLVDGGAR